VNIAHNAKNNIPIRLRQLNYFEYLNETNLVIVLNIIIIQIQLEQFYKSGRNDANIIR